MVALDILEARSDADPELDETHADEEHGHEYERECGGELAAPRAPRPPRWECPCVLPP